MERNTVDTRGNGGGNSGNSFANGSNGASGADSPVTGPGGIRHWDWALAKLHLTIYDLGA
jgi:hypothetical protein